MNTIAASGNPLANSTREKPATTKSSIGGGLGGPKRFLLPTETKTTKLRNAQLKSKEAANATTSAKKFGADATMGNERKEFGGTVKFTPSNNPFSDFAAGADLVVDNIICATEPNDDFNDGLQPIEIPEDDDELLTTGLTPKNIPNAPGIARRKSKSFRGFRAGTDFKKPVSNATAPPK